MGKIRTILAKTFQRICFMKKPAKHAEIDALHSHFDVTGQALDTVQEGIQDVKAEENSNSILNKIGAWEGKCKVLLKVLEKAGNAHPFIKVAVVAFEAAIALELKRRDNDRKVSLIYIQMTDMMTTLSHIVKIEDPNKQSDGKTIEARLSSRMKLIASDIEECGNTCDGYQKSKLIVKVLQSMFWEPRLNTFSKTFSDHKKEIQFDLSIYTVLNIKKVNENTNMELLFSMVRSPEERELTKWVEEHGGAEKCKDDDALFKQLVHLYNEKVKMSRQSDLYTDDEDPKKELEQMVSIKDSLKEDINTLLQDNRKIFERKFELQKIQIDELKENIREEGQKIIKAVISGPHDRILHPIFQEVWKEMAWKGSVKARHFILSLHDYYYYSDEQSRTETAQKSRISSQDKWTLRYMDIERLQPLADALDDDASGFITIREANQFTLSCPKDWSIPQWIAYWAAGFHINLIYYCDQIASILRAMHETKESVLPDNRMIINQYLMSDAIVRINELLAGVDKGRDDVLRGDLTDKELLERTGNRTRDEERRLRQNLDHVAFTIDGPDTLSLITGHGRVETFLTPLIYLLLDRHLKIMHLGRDNILHMNELLSATDSLNKLLEVVNHRLSSLRAIFRHLSRDIDEQFKQVCHGMFAYYNGNHKELSNEIDEYYMHFRDQIRIYGSSVASKHPTKEQDKSPLLMFEGPGELLDFAVYNDTPIAASLSEPQLAGSLEGIWHGSRKHNDGENGPATITFHFSHTGDTLRGYDIRHTRASVTVQRIDQRNGTTLVHFKRAIPRRQFFYRKSDEERYEGQQVGNIISGYWAKEKPAWGKDLHTIHLSETDCTGTFEIEKKPISFFHKSAGAMPRNRPKALWAIAQETTLRSVRMNLYWRFLLKRRMQRKEFIRLLIQYQDNGFRYSDPDDDRKYEELKQTLRQEDAVFYSSMAASILRRRVAHPEALCDTCPSWDRGPIRDTRYVCLVCTARLTDSSFDMCQNCVSQRPVSGTRLGHESNHDILQLRERAPYRPMIVRASQVISTTRTLLRDVRVPLDRRSSSAATLVLNQMRCICCYNIVTCPVWACLICEAGTFICTKCNEHDEREQLWLYEQGRRGARIFCCDTKHHDQEGAPRNVPQSKKHSWLHPLVLCHYLEAPDSNQPLQVDSSKEQNLIKLEGRLADLESRLSTQEGSRDSQIIQFEGMMRDKLDGLEKLLKATNKRLSTISD